MMITIIITIVGNTADGDHDDYIDENNANSTNRVGIKLRQHIGNISYTNDCCDNNCYSWWSW